RFLNGTLRWPHDFAYSEVDDVEPIDTEIPKIVMNAGDDFFTRKGVNPRFVFTTASAYLSHNDQTIRVWMKRLPDYLIGYMRTIKVARVDMVHSGRDRLAQNRNRRVNIAGRSPDLRPGELHRSVAHPIYAH